jgi:hypothetical protein
MISPLKKIALKVGDAHKCPEDHEAKIVWISDNERLIAVKCSQKHFSKVIKVADFSKSRVSLGRYPTKEKKIFVRNLVFLMPVEHGMQA